MDGVLFSCLCLGAFGFCVFLGFGFSLSNWSIPPNLSHAHLHPHPVPISSAVSHLLVSPLTALCSEQRAVEQCSVLQATSGSLRTRLIWYNSVLQVCCYACFLFLLIQSNSCWAPRVQTAFLAPKPSWDWEFTDESLDLWEETGVPRRHPCMVTTTSPSHKS